jgi:hypothetical protein
MRDFVLLLGVIAAISVFEFWARFLRRRRTRHNPQGDRRSASRLEPAGPRSVSWRDIGILADLTFFSGGHESKGWQAALDRYKKNYQGAGHEMGKLEFANLRIEMLGPGCPPSSAENFT